MLFIVSLFFALSLSAYDTLGGVSVPRSESMINHNFNRGDFVFPNETMPGVLSKSLKDPKIKDLLLSVGTFRGLITFGLSPYITHLFLVDIDSKIASFNKAHLDLIKCIADKYDQIYFQRLQYIAHLYGIALLKKPKKEISPKDSAKFVINLLFRRLNFNKITYKEEDNNCLAHLQMEELFKRVIDNNKFHISTKKFLNIHNYDNELYYWQDDLQWQKIINAIKENKIAVSRLDLNNIEDIFSLENFMGEIKLKIGLFDISNILQYIADRYEWQKKIKILQYYLMGKIILTHANFYMPLDIPDFKEEFLFELKKYTVNETNFNSMHYWHYYMMNFKKLLTIMSLYT